MTSTFPSAVPEVPIRDLNRSIEYYREKLGFKLDWSDDSLGLGGVSRGKCRLFLATEEFRTGHGNVGPALIWLNLQSKGEVDALHSEWSANGAVVKGLPESKPWGLHEFVAEDPDGNLFRVFFDFATATGI